MAAEQIRELKPALAAFLSEFDDCYARRDTRAHFPKYVEGYLSDLPRKSVEPRALMGKSTYRLERAKGEGP